MNVAWISAAEAAEANTHTHTHNHKPACFNITRVMGGAGESPFSPVVFAPVYDVQIYANQLLPLSLFLDL